MVNDRMLYLRPGNLFKDFVIEWCVEKVNASGRPVVAYESDGTAMLKGCLASASEKDKAHGTANHIITHVIVQAGRCKCRRADRLLLGDRVFYIVDIDDTGALGVATLYYAEERTDAR